MGPELMLNMSVTSQIKSSAGSAVTMGNSDSTDAKEPIGEEFGKILEREVSETKKQSDTANAKSESSVEKKSEMMTAPTERDTAQTVTAGQEGTSDPTQHVLADTVNKIDVSQMSADLAFDALDLMLNPASLALNPEAAAATGTALTPAILQQVTASQNVQQTLGSVSSMANQLLQQKLLMQNVEDSHLTVVSTHLVQSLELENSAAFGKILPLASEIGDVLQSDLGDSFTTITDNNTLTSQLLGPNGTATATTATTNLAHGVAEKVHVDAPVGHAKWGGELAQKVVWLASQQSQVAEIHLNPAHLGPVEVMLSISQDQATAQFVSAHPAVRDAIQDALPRLREMLAENGIQLGNVMVGADSFQQQSGQQHAQQSHSRSEQGNFSMMETDNQSMTPGSMGASTTTASRHHGLVNTFA